MAPSRCRILTECIITGFGTVIGFAFITLGLYTKNYHTILWGWFSGFCAFRVYSLQSTYLKSEFHDKYCAEQLSKLKIISAYLLLGSMIASAYYLPFAVIYNKSFSILNPENDDQNNYWPPLMASLLSTVWLTLLLYNVIIYRKYLLTENIPNVTSDENRPLLARA